MYDWHQVLSNVESTVSVAQLLPVRLEKHNQESRGKADTELPELPAFHGGSLEENQPSASKNVILFYGA